VVEAHLSAESQSHYAVAVMPVRLEVAWFLHLRVCTLGVAVRGPGNRVVREGRGEVGSSRRGLELVGRDRRVEGGGLCSFWFLSLGIPRTTLFACVDALSRRMAWEGR
jgi:hypothetical protein